MNKIIHNRTTKVTFFICCFGAGGKERQLHYLIKSLINICSIQLIIFDQFIFYQDIFALPIDLTSFQREHKYTLRSLVQVYKELNRFKPDVIHSWDNISHCIALPYILMNRVNVVNGSIRYAGLIKRNIIGRCIQKIAFANSDRIISNSNKGLYVENLLTSKKARTIHNGFDIVSFSKIKSNSHDKLFDLLNSFTNTVVMVGRFFSLKDYITFVRAANHVLRKKPEVGFFCIGEGPDLEKTKTEAGPWLNNNIFFLGKRNDVHQIIHAFDIGVLLNNINGHAEGISNAIMEYMAAGLPVIATNAGGTPELVIEQESGFLVPAFNPEIVAQKILFLLENRHKGKEMGQKGLEIIRNRFSLERMSLSYLNLYKSLLNEQ